MKQYKQADPQNREAAKAVAKKCGVNIVYRNSKGEFFTSDNPALNSDKAENIEVHDFTKADAPAAGGKAVKLSKANFTKYPELAVNGWEQGDEVEELDWAIKNKKPEEPKA